MLQSIIVGLLVLKFQVTAHVLSASGELALLVQFRFMLFILLLKRTGGSPEFTQLLFECPNLPLLDC